MLCSDKERRMLGTVKEGKNKSIHCFIVKKEWLNININ